MSAAVINFLSQLFERFGLVKEIITDNGVQFTSSEFTDFLAAHNIKHTKLALYAPQANATERLNRILKEGIKAAMAEGKPFLTGLRQTLAAYRSMPQGTTGVSPSKLMLAFPMRMPLTALTPMPTSSGSTAVQRSTLRARVEQKQNKMAAYHDKRKQAHQSAIDKGDWVRILLPRHTHKLAATYSEPRLVVNVRGNTVWTRGGQAWNLRRCIRHHPGANSSPTRLSANRSLIGPSQHPVDDADNAEDETTGITLLPPPPADPPRPRRSNRVRRPRNFGADFLLQF